MQSGYKKKSKPQSPTFPTARRGGCAMLDGGEYTNTKRKTKTNFIFSIRTKIPILIDNMEHDFSSTISIYVF